MVMGLINSFLDIAIKTDKVTFTKDLAMVVDTLRGLIYRDFGMKHTSHTGIRDELVERYDLPGIVQSGGDVHAFTAAVAGQAGVEVVAIVGVLGVARGRDRERLPGLCVFVEWPDGRWWNALRIVRDASLHEEMPVMIRTADEGYPRPGGLGGWWSRSRFQGLSLRISRSGGQAGAGLVH